MNNPEYGTLSISRSWFDLIIREPAYSKCIEVARYLQVRLLRESCVLEENELIIYFTFADDMFIIDGMSIKNICDDYPDRYSDGEVIQFCKTWG